MTQNLIPGRADGFRVEAWNELDATIKNQFYTAAEDMAVPPTSTMVSLQVNVDTWYNLTGTAAVPTDDSTAHSFLPAGERRLIPIGPPGTVSNISLVASAAAIACGMFWD